VVRTAFEVQYPCADAFSGGVADAFGEHNLGGIELRVKIEVADGASARPVRRCCLR
jgi:hypothetical protein